MTLKQYLFNLLAALSQFGNALSGGNRDVSISARTGYMALKSPIRYRWFWLSLEKIINWAFAPIDGRAHCYWAFQEEFDESIRQGPIASMLLIALFAVCLTPLIALVTYSIGLFIGGAGPRDQEPNRP